jgi:hypothetical protein
MFLDGVPTVNWWPVERYVNRVVCVERGQGSGIAVDESIVHFFKHVANASRSFRSGVFDCWAKVGTAKVMANPARVSSRRIFIASFS